ncbi:MAG TPA: hypothetical protein VEV15_13580 [Flavisolibacter sp.]|nr:hypothetical protein [Flavisolibacter sp.]
MITLTKYATIFILLISASACGDVSGTGKYSYTPTADEPKKDNTPSKSVLESHKTTAYVVGKEFIKAKLTSPSTASFPWGGSSKVTFEEDSSYRILSYVDSENGYGDEVRTHYNLLLKFHGGEWLLPRNWSVEYLNMW